MKNPRKLTIQESGETIKPYTTLPTKNVKCITHEFEKRADAFGHLWYQCKVCSLLK